MGKPLSKPSKETPERTQEKYFNELSKSAKEKYSLEIAQTNYDLHHHNKLCEEANGIIGSMKMALDHWKEVLADELSAVDYYQEKVSEINKKYNVYEYEPEKEMTFTAKGFYAGKVLRVVLEDDGGDLPF